MKHSFLVILAVLCMASSAFADLTIVEDASPLQSKNYNSGNADISNAPLLTFKVKAEQSDVTIKSVGVSVMADPSTRPTTLYTYSGSTLLGSVAVSQSQLEVPADDLIVPAGTSVALKVSGDFFSVQSGAMWVQTYGVNIVENGIQKFVGIQSPTRVILGPQLRFIPTVANFYAAAAPTTSTVSNADGTTNKVTTTFTLNVNALGNSSNTGVRVNNATIIAVSENGVGRAVYGNVPFTMIPSGDIADMSSATMKIVAEFPVGVFPSSGNYHFYIQQIGWAASDGSSTVEQYWGLENLITPFATPVLKAGSSQSVKFRLTAIGFQQWYDINAYNEGGEWGIPGQVVSEGGLIRISSDNLTPIAIVVFPVAAPFVAQFAQVEADITSYSIVPKFYAPQNPLLRFNGPTSNDRVLWPVSNLHTNDNNTYTFTVHIGDFTGYGSLYRTGAKSCVIRMFWGEGATNITPGTELDMLDKSPSLPFDEGGRVEGAMPSRVRFKVKDQSMSGSAFIMRADLLIGGVTVEQSTDQVNWNPLPFYLLDEMSRNTDGTSDCLITIGSQASTRSFYRLKLNQ